MGRKMGRGSYGSLDQALDSPLLRNRQDSDLAHTSRHCPPAEEGEMFGESHSGESEGSLYSSDQADEYDHCQAKRCKAERRARNRS